MGTIVYGFTGQVVSIDDRALKHLQVVIIAKLRRGEGFAFHWETPVPEGDGHAVLWLHPSVPLIFTFDEARPPSINRQWLEMLSVAANSSAGLKLMPEPSDHAPQVPTVTGSVAR